MSAFGKAKPDGKNLSSFVVHTDKFSVTGKKLENVTVCTGLYANNFHFIFFAEFPIYKFSSGVSDDGSDGRLSLHYQHAT